MCNFISKESIYLYDSVIVILEWGANTNSISIHNQRLHLKDSSSWLLEVKCCPLYFWRFKVWPYWSYENHSRDCNEDMSLTLLQTGQSTKKRETCNRPSFLLYLNRVRWSARLWMGLRQLLSDPLISAALTEQANTHGADGEHSPDRLSQAGIQHVVLPERYINLSAQHWAKVGP